MLIVGGSLVAGSDNPHRGTPMPLGPSTPSVGVSNFAEEYIAHGHFRILVLRQTTGSRNKYPICS
jgi:hypothetical protein